MSMIPAIFVPKKTLIRIFNSLGCINTQYILFIMFCRSIVGLIHMCIDDSLGGQLLGFYWLDQYNRTRL